MNEAPFTTEQLFGRFGNPNSAPKAGQTVSIERAGKTDEAAFTLGEIVNVHVGGVHRESRVVVKEKYVNFSDGKVTSPHRSPLILTFQHFAKSIQERLGGSGRTSARGQGQSVHACREAVLHRRTD